MSCSDPGCSRQAIMSDQSSTVFTFISSCINIYITTLNSDVVFLLSVSVCIFSPIYITMLHMAL